MLCEFLTAFPAFFLALFGLFHISEFAYRKSVADYASFVAVRGQFVDEDGEELANKSVESVSSSLGIHEPAKIEFDPSSIAIQYPYFEILPHQEIAFWNDIASVQGRTSLPTRGLGK